MPSAHPLILIAAGGTGGHVFPGLAVAEEISRLCPSARIEFVGSTAPLALEKTLVPKAGFRLHRLAAFPLNTKSPVVKIRGALVLPLALVQAAGLLVRTRPAAVLGIGGYASGPLLLMASLFGFRTMIVEPNAMPGFTNRVLSRFVDKAACAYEAALPHFGTKGVVTGNPIRSSFKALPPKSHTPPLRLLCFGGSQGSRILSEGLLHAIDSLPPEEELTIVHQTGATQREAVQAAYEAKGRKAEVIAFIEDMSKALGEADLVLGRAGGSIAELTVAGKASVLVPLKSAADDHQTMNARAMQDAGAAVMVEEKDLVTLGAVITDLVRNPSKIEQLETRARALGRPDAAAKVATMLLEWAGVRSAAA